MNPSAPPRPSRGKVRTLQQRRVAIHIRQPCWANTPKIVPGAIFLRCWGSFSAPGASWSFWQFHTLGKKRTSNWNPHGPHVGPWGPCGVLGPWAPCPPLPWGPGAPKGPLGPLGNRALRARGTSTRIRCNSERPCTAQTRRGWWAGGVGVAVSR